MDDFLRGALAASGFSTALFSLLTFSLVFQYAPFWGPRASSYVVVAVVLTYLALGAATLAFVPRVRVTDTIGAVGGAIAVLFGLGVVYYGTSESGSLGVYFLFILVLATAVLSLSAVGFVLVGRTMLASADRV